MAFSQDDTATNGGSAVLQLRNQLEALEDLSDWIASLAEQYDFSSKLAFELDLVLGEAVTNVIQNAYGDGEAHEITVTLEYGNGVAIAQIRDDGRFFDPLQYPEVELPTSLADAVEGGLGIHLIRSYAQSCDYQRQDRWNVLTLTLAAN